MWSPFSVVGEWMGGENVPPAPPPFPVQPPVTATPAPTPATGAVVIVPTLSNTPQIPPYRQRVTLDGVVYGLTFRWNARAQVWTYAITTSGGTLVADSIPVRNGLPLAAWAKTVAGMTPGDFWAVPVDHDPSDAAQDQLGARVLMAYLGAA